MHADLHKCSRSFLPTLVTPHLLFCIWMEASENWVSCIRCVSVRERLSDLWGYMSSPTSQSHSWLCTWHDWASLGV